MKTGASPLGAVDYVWLCVVMPNGNGYDSSLMEGPVEPNSYQMEVGRPQ